MPEIKEDYAIDLNWCELLTPLNDPDYDRITQLAAIICDVPTARITILSDDNQWYKPSLLNDIKPDDGHQFCRHTLSGSGIFEISDVHQDKRFAFNASPIRFYAGCPLKDENGKLLGTLSVTAPEPRSLTCVQKNALQLLAGQVTDLITARRQKHDLDHFEKLFLLSNDLIFIGGEDGFFKRVNPAFTKTLGWDESYLLNTSTFDLIHPDDIANTTTQLGNMIKGKNTENFLQRFRCRNGEYRTLQWASIPENMTGNIYGIGRDVTETIALQKALKHTTEMLERTNKVARIGGWELDLKTQELYWSTVTREIHETAPGFIPDLTNAIDFYKKGPSRDKIIDAVNLATTKGIPYDVELEMVTAQGNEIWVRAMGDVELENGVCKRLYGTFQDIDEYKKSEQALKSSIETQEKLNSALINQIELVGKKDQTIKDIQEYKFLADSIPEIIWTSNADGTIDYYNRYWFDYAGLTAEETNALGWNSIVHPEDDETDREYWQESLATGKPYQAELRFKRKDGSYRWHLSRALPMKNNRGEIVKWFGSCTDIDEYKRALDLESKISQFEDFNRIIAHNLRGPAGSIKMMLKMMGETNTPEETEELLSMLNSSSGALNDTLNELMKVMEVRNNKDMAYDNCSFNAITDVVSIMLKGQILDKKAVIQTRFDVAEMDFPKLYLESIFYNMISNAIKYGKPGLPPQIDISSSLVNGQVMLSFKDNGLGIDLEKHGADMFKLNSVFHSGYDSKGVGLFMTKTQIDTFGGKISVESEPGIGTTFTILF